MNTILKQLLGQTRYFMRCIENVPKMLQKSRIVLSILIERILWLVTDKHYINKS